MPAMKKRQLAAEDLRDMILRMSKKGMRINDIAAICDVPAAQVVLLGQDDEWSRMVKRLTKDPAELCCCISQELFENPVVAEDGNTYEMQYIQKWLVEESRSPLTGATLNKPVQLLRNRDMMSRIISFKEEIVAEILSIAPLLLKAEFFEALERLLQRAECFVRPLFVNDDNDDASARKKLLRLLTIRMRMPPTDEVHAAREEVHKLLDQVADRHIEALLCGIEESELRGLLCKVECDMLESLHSKMKASNHICRHWIDHELACRLATLLGEDCCFEELWQLLENGNDRRFQQLWAMLVQNCHHDGPLNCYHEQQQWAKAAGVVLATCADRVKTPLHQLDLGVLNHAHGFLNKHKQALDFAESFFRYDFGIADEEVWPPSPSARIVMELAERSCQQEEKLQLLLRAYRICASDALIRRALLDAFHCQFLDSDSPSACTTADVEELYLQLISQEERTIPMDVIHKLSFKESCLQHFKGDLMLLAKQLRQAGRSADGGRVAVMLAQRLAKDGENERAEDAFFFAFRLDPANSDAANGLWDFAQLVIATKKTGNRLPSCGPRILSEMVESQKLLEWNLSEKDFTKLKADGMDSQKFRISRRVIAWMSIFPQEPYPKCILNLNRAADVKLRVLVGNSTQDVEICNGMKFQSFYLGSHSDLSDRMTVYSL